MRERAVVAGEAKWTELGREAYDFVASQGEA